MDTHDYSIILTGPHHQRYQIRRFLQLLVGTEPEPYSGDVKPTKYALPYSQIAVDGNAKIHLFGSLLLRHVDMLAEILPAPICLILVSSITPESWHEVRSMLETLRHLHIPFVIVAHPAEHPDTWDEKDIREVLELGKRDVMLHATIDSLSDATQLLAQLLATAER